MSKTEIDWLEYFAGDIIFTKITDTGSRAYVLWDVDRGQYMDPKLPDLHTIYTMPIYLDKLPTTNEGAKVYFFQAFSKLSRLLREESRALAKVYWASDFKFEGELRLKTESKIEAMHTLTRIMGKAHKPGYFVNFKGWTNNDGMLTEHPWLDVFAKLTSSWYPVLVADADLPDGLKFWK